MNTAGIEYSELKKIKFFGRRFQFTGVTAERAEELGAGVMRFGGVVVPAQSFAANYLVVGEDCPYQTALYRLTVQRNRLGASIGILSDRELERFLCDALLKSQPKPQPRREDVPLGGGRLLFRDTVWSTLGITSGIRKEAEERILEQQGVLGDVDEAVYCVYDTERAPEEPEWREAKRREAEGSLILLPREVFFIWSAREPEKTELSYAGCAVAVSHYLSYPEVWKSSVNGAEQAIVSFMKKDALTLLNKISERMKEPFSDWLCANMDREWLLRKHTVLLRSFFLAGCFNAMFDLLGTVRAWERDQVSAGGSDGLYVYSLIDTYLEKLNELKDTEQRARFLNVLRERFLEAQTGAGRKLALREGRSADIYLAPGTEHTFGRYPQTENGDLRPIEWTVLAREGEKALLISKYVLDAKPFHRDGVYTNWEKCSLREWLNGAFMDTAFDSRERGAILTQTVDNGFAQGVPEYGTACRDTRDSVFLLSYAEAWKYYNDNAERVCVPTDYALAQGISNSRLTKRDGRPAGSWWLRSIGYHDDYAVKIDACGYRENREVNRSEYGVRPALWVDISALEQE